MYPEQLPSQAFYSYTNSYVFSHPTDRIHGFIMKDYSIDMHVQEFIEINLVTQGTGMHYLENRRIAARRGDVFIIPPHMPHGYVGGKGFDVYHVLISNQFMEKYMADLRMLDSFFILFRAEPLMRNHTSEPLHLTLSDEQFEELEPLLNAIYQYSAPRNPADSIFCNSNALMLITSLCRIYTKNNISGSMIQDTPGTESGGTSTVQSLLPQASDEDEAFLHTLAMIHEKYYEKLSITQLAKTAQLSRSSFLRRFQEVCHMPPAKYLTRRRIEAAQYMLSNTVLSVSEIAIRTGFYDAAHFSRIFSAEVGFSPGQYRKEQTTEQPTI